MRTSPRHEPIPTTQPFSIRMLWQHLHCDGILLIGILLLIAMGLAILYSASNQNSVLMEHQLIHIALAFGILFLFAQITPATYQRWAVWIYIIGLLLLCAVLVMGHIGKGALRWLTIGGIRFQPSEIMKLAIPLFLASHCDKIHLPLTYRSILFMLIIIAIPTLLTAKQPDLGTAILLLASGGSLLLLAGLPWRILTFFFGLLGLCLPIIWYAMHDYQKQRIFIFLNPERDPLGHGYHIIQSKIAIGSGGAFGKGWLNGTQSHLHFLPEHTTDFIFAVCGEEFGFIGNLILISLFMLLVLRGFSMTLHAQDTFTRLLAGSLTSTFFISFFINMGMVTGILPVVGLPLPLVSYGGSSLLTIMASFGILMSIQTHRKLLTT